MSLRPVYQNLYNSACKIVCGGVYVAHGAIFP